MLIEATLESCPVEHEGVVDAAECKVAAASLGVTWGSESASSENPSGCFQKGDTAYYNTATGAPNPLVKSICREVDTSVTSAGKKKCVVKGDPHVKMWSQTDADGARLGLYGTYADYWLVHTDQLKVMGRIGSVDYAGTEGVLKGTAISGSLLDNKVLIIPPTNNGDITFDGVPIKNFPFESAAFNMTLGVTENFQNYPVMKDRENSYTITMGTKVEIKMNQDVFQHLQILADESLVAEDKGLCEVMCRDWFNCQGPICDLKDSLFVTTHPQCGEVILRKKCNKLRQKLATEDCKKSFADASADRPAAYVGMGIQNCIEDCCADREQCPDRDDDGTATCLIFGDPHIKGFDAVTTSMQTFSPMGTHSLVKSDYISVQANYVSAAHIRAQMEGISFTGPLVSDAGVDGKHSVISILPDKGGVVIDGTVVMSCKEAEECSEAEKFYDDPNGGHFNITFGPGSDIPELLQDQRPIPQRKNVYTIKFFQGASVLVHEGHGQSVYMQFGTRLLSGVSGECGNFNGDPSDDGHPRIDTAKTHCPSQAEIFTPGGVVCGDVDVNMGAGCKTYKKLHKYRPQCMNHLDMTGRDKNMDPDDFALLKACMTDCCLGGTCPDNKPGADNSDEDY
jgi:hypothetical protein